MNVTPRRLALAAVAAALALPGVAEADCHADASYCADNDVVSVSVVARDGRLEVHRGGWTYADQFVFCAPQLLLYLSHPERDYEQYRQCAFEPNRVV